MRSAPVEGRVRRLAEELNELDPGILSGLGAGWVDFLEELDYALRPKIHERRVPSYGAIVGPETEPARWAEGAGFDLDQRRVSDLNDATVRRFADGIVSWVVRGEDGVDDLIVFDRSVGSERDLTVLAEATGGAIVQRHPAGVVRAAGPFGVLRHEGIGWHLEAPLDRWLDLDSCSTDRLDRSLLKRFVRFAVHDVGARRIGALFVVTAEGDVLPSAERRLGRPPAFNIGRPSDLAPLYHVLGQLDGAAVFDHEGTLRHLGVRLVPSPAAEAGVDPYRGTRHTSAMRYSYDDRGATIIVVSEDGPVTVIRAGQRLGSSADGLRLTTRVPVR